MQEGATVCWVFDLDDTLMPTQAVFHNSKVRDLISHAQRVGEPGEAARRWRFVQAYRKIVSADPPLVSAIARLRGTKVLLTNGSRDHAYASLSALRLLPHFYGQLDRDSGVGMKPNPTMYDTLHQHVLQEQRHTSQSSRPVSFIFFDDLEQNLVYPRQLQWTTVWITGAQPRPRRRLPHVNYMFRTVHEALAFFSNRN